MQSAAKIAVSLILLMSAIASAYQGSIKLRRDGVLNLYPFPRVGRASHQTWDLSPRDQMHYGNLEYKPSQKRQLYAFPRVGRNDALMRAEPFQMSTRLEELLLSHSQPHAFSKRESENTDSSGMWFGPRLGRMFSDDDEDEVQLKDDQSESELDQAHNEERKKRQTKQI